MFYVVRVHFVQSCSIQFNRFVSYVPPGTGTLWLAWNPHMGFWNELICQAVCHAKIEEQLVSGIYWVWVSFKILQARMSHCFSLRSRRGRRGNPMVPSFPFRFFRPDAGDRFTFMGLSIVMGVPSNGWFISRKIPLESLEWMMTGARFFRNPPTIGHCQSHLKFKFFVNGGQPHSEGKKHCKYLGPVG